VPVGAPHEAILVTEAALGTDQGRKFVYVVRARPDPKTHQPQEVIEQQMVEIGALQPDGMRVIEKGVTLKDRVIVTGLQRIRPKMEVQTTAVPMQGQLADRPSFSTNATTQGK